MGRKDKLVVTPNEPIDNSEIDSGNLSIKLRCSVPFCEYKSNKQSNLDRHHKAMHQSQQKQKSRICCGKKFLTNFEHNEHRKKHHKGGFQCKHCKKEGINRKFPRKGLLERHENTHTGRKPYGCSACVYICGNKSNVNRHIAKKHEVHEKAYVQTTIDGKITAVDQDTTESSSESLQKDGNSNSCTNTPEPFSHPHSIASILSRPYKKTIVDATATAVHPNQNETSFNDINQLHSSLHFACQPELPEVGTLRFMQQQSIRVPTSFLTTKCDTFPSHNYYYNNTPYQIDYYKGSYQDTTFTKYDKSLIVPGSLNFSNYPDTNFLHAFNFKSSQTTDCGINCKINVIGNQHSYNPNTTVEKRSVAPKLFSKIEQESCPNSCSFYLGNQSVENKVISFNSEGAFDTGLGSSKISVERTRRVLERNDETHFMNEISPVSLKPIQEVYFMNGAQAQEINSTGSSITPHVVNKTMGREYVERTDSEVPEGLRNKISFINLNSGAPADSHAVYHPKKLRQKYINVK